MWISLVPTSRTFRAAPGRAVPRRGVLAIPVDVHGLDRPALKLMVSVRLSEHAEGAMTFGLERPDGASVALSTFNVGQGRHLGGGAHDAVAFDEAAEPSMDVSQTRALNGRWRVIVTDVGTRRSPALVLAAALTFVL